MKTQDQNEPQGFVTAVGQPYPYQRHHVAQSLMVTRTEYFFSLCLEWDKIGTRELRWFKEISLHLYTKDAIQFIILKFGPGMLDCTFNFHRVNPEARTEWLTNNENIVPIALVEDQTGIVKALKILSNGDAHSDKLRQVLAAQLGAYNSIEAVDDKARRIMADVSLEYMYARRVM